MPARLWDLNLYGAPEHVNILVILYDTKCRLQYDVKTVRNSSELRNYQHVVRYNFWCFQLFEAMITLAAENILKTFLKCIHKNMKTFLENISKTFLKQTKCPLIKGFKTFLKTY